MLLSADPVGSTQFYLNQGSGYWMSDTAVDQATSFQACSPGTAIKIQTVQEMEFLVKLLSNRASAGGTVLPHYFIGKLTFSAVLEKRRYFLFIKKYLINKVGLTCI